MSNKTGACENFHWDPASAARKASSDISVSVNIGPVGISKQISGPNDPTKDAYRNCECGHHYNHHKH